MLLASPTKCNCQYKCLAQSQNMSIALNCMLLLRDSYILVVNLPARLQLWVQSHKQS